MRFSRTKEGDVILGIAPLIDIVFLLLIFFMVTSHFDISTGVKVRLPSMSEKKKESLEEKELIVINEKGEVFIDKEEIPINQLEKRLRQLNKEKGINGVILQADKDVRHGLVIKVMDKAKRAGIGSVFISARFVPNEAK